MQEELSKLMLNFIFVREAVSDEYIELPYCPTEQIVADVLTKTLNHDRFETFRLEMGLESI